MDFKVLIIKINEKTQQTIHFTCGKKNTKLNVFFFKKSLFFFILKFEFILFKVHIRKIFIYFYF